MRHEFTESHGYPAYLYKSTLCISIVTSNFKLVSDVCRNQIEEIITGSWHNQQPIFFLFNRMQLVFHLI